ncbi:rRNA pseudouridine synthase [Lacihabitans sp. LS3-19]|nr:rRNA pseudouridine synthase [Lacihabitans sp. LS3-19]
MVSQFVGHDIGNMLGKINFDFPEGTHAIGRLDNLSEGLLILTTNKKVTKLLFQSKVPHRRTYIIQVDACLTTENIESLRTGVNILLRGNSWWITSPCEVELIEKPDEIYNIVNTLHPRHPHKWLKMTLTEGKYHQIRKMIIAVNNKCKRLIRTSIEDLELGDLPVGEVREYTEQDFFEKLKIENYSSQIQKNHLL